MRRLNVLICITQLELGGAQQGTLYLVKNLDKTRFRVVFVSSPGELTEEAVRIRDAKIILLDSLQRNINFSKDLQAFKDLKRIIKEEQIDIIHTNSSKAGILGRWAGWWMKVPVIVHTIHGWPFHDYMPPRQKKMYVWLERLTARISSKLIAVAHANIEKGLNEKIGKESLYQVIHCGIEINKFQKSSADREAVYQEFHIPSQVKLVGMVACFKPQKCPVDFVKVASKISKQLPNVYFMLVGDGELRPEIEENIKNLGLENKFILTGWRADVPRLMSAFDVLAHTSLWEGLPCVFPQAMAKKIPIVATNVDGASEAIIDEKTGYLVFPHEIDRMALKIILLLKNPKERDEMGKNALNFLAPFDIDLMVKEYDKLFTQLATEKIKEFKKIR